MKFAGAMTENAENSEICEWFLYWFDPLKNWPCVISYPSGGVGKFDNSSNNDWTYWFLVSFSESETRESETYEGTNQFQKTTKFNTYSVYNKSQL